MQDVGYEEVNILHGDKAHSGLSEVSGLANLCRPFPNISTASRKPYQIKIANTAPSTILEKGEEPFAMLRDLQINHPDRVFKVIRYPSLDRLVEVLDNKIIMPAQARFARLVKRKAAEMGVVDV
jgi:hypothetical protein